MPRTEEGLQTYLLTQVCDVKALQSTTAQLSTSKNQLLG